MGITEKLKSKYKLFMDSAKEADLQFCFIYFLHWLTLWIRYRVPLKDYFQQKLYDRNRSHDEYYNSSLKVIRNWKNSRKRFYPNATPGWIVFHYVDYLVSRLIYPGLDGMDYFSYEFYRFKRCVRKTFITEGQLRKMNSLLNNVDDPNAKEEFDILLNKARFNEYFSDIVNRKWVLSDTISYSEFCSFCTGLSRIICKPVAGVGGRDIFIANLDSQEAMKDVWNKVKSNRFIIEEVLEQHNELAQLNPSSVNTIRLYTVKSGEQYYITGAALRIGRKGKQVDNYHSGGLAAEINIELGMVTSRAISFANEEFYIHPDSGKCILGFMIPGWEKIKSTVRNAHRKLSSLGYVAWDVVVLKDGSITFIEANTGGGVDLQQHPSLTGKKPIYQQYCNL